MDKGQFCLVISGILASFSVLAYFIFTEYGAWWQLDSTFTNFTFKNYINAVGMRFQSATGEDFIFLLGIPGLLAGIIFMIGILTTFISASNDNRKLAFVSSFIFLTGMITFIFSLMTATTYDSLMNGLSIITNGSYNLLGGTINLGLDGSHTWSLGIGFYIAGAAFIFALVGAILME